MQPFATFSELISAWPSLAEFAADLKLNYETAKKMRHRNSIAPEYWDAIVAAAKRRGIRGVTTDLMLRLRERKGVAA